VTFVDELALHLVRGGLVGDRVRIRTAARDGAERKSKSGDQKSEEAHDGSS
jgi:hypothetical protein